MKIVYMGTPAFAVKPLEAILSAGYEVPLVLTREDKRSGRGKAVHFSPVKEAALRAGIEVLQPGDMRSQALRERLCAADADLFVTAAYGKLLPEEILAIPRIMCINIHASLLPAYRGAAPIQHAVIDGQRETGVTTMRMDAGLDTGDILRQYRIPILPEDTGGTLTEKLSSLGADAVLDTIRGLEENEIRPVPQGAPTTPYASMLTKELGNLDWKRPAEELWRLIRGLDPWPAGYSFLNGKMLKLWRTHVTGEAEAEALGTDASKAEPGSILLASGRNLAVMTGDGVLWIDELQPEGKKRMETEAYLRGARLAPGMRFASLRG